MKRLVLITLIALMGVFVFVGVPHAHAQSLHPNFSTGFCLQESCDSLFQDGGYQNCSVMQGIVTQQTLHDAAGRAFAVGYLFDSSAESSQSRGCYSDWGGMNFLPGFGLHRDDGTQIGTLNTKIYSGDEYSGASWVSTEMIAAEDRSGTCVSAWWNGVDISNNVQEYFHIKLIGGGQNC